MIELLLEEAGAPNIRDIDNTKKHYLEQFEQDRYHRVKWRVYKEKRPSFQCRDCFDPKQVLCVVGCDVEFHANPDAYPAPNSAEKINKKNDRIQCTGFIMTYTLGFLLFALSLQRL
jgi:hypothetical protein